MTTTRKPLTKIQATRIVRDKLRYGYFRNALGGTVRIDGIDHQFYNDHTGRCSQATKVAHLVQSVMDADYNDLHPMSSY